MAPHTSRMMLAAICLTIISRVASAADASFRLAPHERGVKVYLDDQLFTDYLANAGPKPYLWPILGPGGVPMTRAYPMEKIAGEKQDHPHQRSLWFTHGNVNGVDFWAEGDDAGKIVHRQFSALDGGDTAVIASINTWMSPAGETICSDERKLTFRTMGDVRAIDFEIKLIATEGPVVLGDTKEGTFGIRVPTSLDVEQEDGRAGGTIVNSEGQTNADAWGKAASWVDYHGPIHGETMGIAVLNHPQSFRYPTYWHVRTYGLFAANPFGKKDFLGADDVDGSHRIELGESITLRYRVIFHRGDHVQAGIAEAFRDYAQTE